MPIYDYTCRACGRAFEEVVVRASDAAGIACPRCQARDVERRMSAPAASRSSGGRAPARPARGCGPVG